MKKNFFLTLMLAVFSIATSWAQSPDDGVYTIAGDANLTRGYMCAGQNYANYPVLTEITYSGCTDNSVAAITNGKNWYVTTKAKGTYIYNLGLDKYLVKDNGNINFGDTPYAWTIKDNGNFKAIYDAALEKYLSMGCGRGPADRPIAWDTNANDGGAKHTFTAVENGATTFATQIAKVEADLAALIDTDSYVLLKSPSGTYLSTTAPSSTNTRLSFQAEGTKFLLETASNGYYIRVRDAKPATYVAQSTSNTWDCTTSTTPYIWFFSEPDANGFITISDDAGNLGSDSNTNVGTGIFANVGGDCNKWLVEGTYENYPTEGTVNNNKYHFTSDYITYAGACNKIRFTLTESGAFFQNGKNRMSLDEFAIYDADGKKIELTVANVTGNNNKTYAGLFDGVNGTCGGTATWTDGTEDDWFEILLPDGVDLGGAFKFSFVTENTTMNAKKFTINTSYESHNYAFVINAPQDQNVTVKYNGNVIKNGDIIKGADFDTGLIEATDIEGYTWKVVVNSKEKTITLAYVKKYSLHIVGAPNGVTLTYNDNEIGEGYYFDAEFDLTQFVVNNLPQGYSWEVSKDTEGKFVVVTFTALVTVENPAAVVALIKRIGGDGVEDKFKFVLEPSLNYDQEVFVIGGEDGKVLIKGTTISAITTGIGWYLNNYAHINIAWNSLNEKTVSGAAYADLSNISVPTGTETRTCDAKYRYYLNYCTFGYSMTTWTWKRWQQEIDWMALHGVNMPLQIVGLEEVWRKFLTLEENSKRKYNYSDEEAKAFVPGPAFTAWWAMNNLEGWGGTAADGWGGVQDDAWYTRQANLAKQICARQRELGMEPVLPGFSGMVPSNFQTKTGVACDAAKWCGFTRPKIVLPSNERFAEIAADYYACLEAVMGESQYYSIDPFHEGGSISNGSQSQYEDAYKAIYNAMENAKPGSQWVIQQWQWNHNDPNFQAYSINAVPVGRLIVLDLFSDGRPEFDDYKGYAPQEAVFCAVPNFGGRSGLMGRLQNVTDNYFMYKAKYPATLKGFAAAPEAIEQTPIAYDLLFQLPWMGAKPDVKEWVKNYSIARYGVENAEIQVAWDLLRQGPLNYGADAIQGPVEDVWAARPNLDANKASSWGNTLNNAQNTYTKERQLMLIDATYRLLAQYELIEKGSIYESNYNYDIVEFGGAVMADYAYYLLKGIKEAKEASNTALYEARRDAFLKLILDVDKFKGTNLNFRLGKWTQEARAAAAEVEGATIANADWYEYNNARTLITTWGDSDQNGNGGVANGLKDYSYRSWQGMLKDYYFPRWKYYFDNDCTHPDGNAKNYFYFEWNWAHGMTHAVGDKLKSTTSLTAGQQGHTDSYTREPEGNTIDEANKMLAKYIIPLKTDNGTYYAYRYLTNNIPAEYKVEGAEGGKIDFSKFFLANLDGATVTGDFTNGTANDITTVPVKSDIAGNTYDAVMTLTDGTVLNFKVVVNSAEMVAAKAELAALIEKMEALTAQVGSYKSVATEITLTTTQGNDYYIWCNNLHDSGDDAAGGVEALLDEDPNSYLHTDYTNKSTIHDYLQIDFGNAVGLDNFKIAGQQRSGGSNDRPRDIEIYGSNDNSTWTPVATVTGLPNSQGATWESDAIYSDVKYSHLKFVVKTHDNYNQTSSVSRPYFHMAKFDIFELSTAADVIDVYDGTELTDAFAAEKYDVLLAAINVYKTATTPEQIAAATTALQAAYKELQKLVGVQQPEEPVGFNGVYNIVYNGKPVFIAYAGANELAGLTGSGNAGFRLFDATTTNTDSKHLTIQNNAIAAHVPADALFTIVPSGDGYKISAQGQYMRATGVPSQWAIQAFDTEEDNAGTYLFEETEVADVFKLKSTINIFTGSDVTNYVNDWGPVFGNDMSNKENLSTFTLTPVTEYKLTVPANGVTTFCLPFNVVLPAGLVAYDVTAVGNNANGEKVYQLTQLAARGEKVMAGTPVIVKGSAGEYTLGVTIDNTDAKGALEGSLLRGNFVSKTLAVANVDKYTFTADAEFTLLTTEQEIAANSVWMEFDVTIEVAIKEGVVVEPDTPDAPDATVTKPELGKVYRIKNYTVNTPDEYKYHYLVNSNVSIAFPTSVEGDDKSAMWVCTGADTDTHKYTFASALGTAALGWQGVAEDALEYTISDGTIAGTVTLANGTTSLALTTEAWNNSGKAAFNQASNSGKAQADYWSTDWYLEEVENPGVSYTASINKGNMWATMYLPYAVTIPQGVDVYYAVEGAIKENVITLTQFIGTIPARTAVLLHRAGDAPSTGATENFEFALAEDVEAVDNLFEGKILTTAICVKNTNYIGEPYTDDDYKVYLLVNYNGKEKFYWMADEYDANCVYKGDGSYYVKCDANKAYLKLKNNLTNISSLSFRYEGTTDIEEVKGENGKVKAIYDLQGRKLTEITKPGFYIVDGEKVFVK